MLNNNLQQTIAFFLRFNLFAIPLYFILPIVAISQIQYMITDIVQAMLFLSGIPVIRSELLLTIPIHTGSWAAVINWDCVGWKSMLFFTALVFATPCKASKKMLALALLPIIFIMNILRIWFMFWYVHTFNLAHFQIIHTVFWSFGLIVVALILWLIWIKKM